MKKILFVIALLVSSLLQIQAQSMHLIVFANTIDKKIGCQVDVENVVNEISIVADALNLQYIPYVKTGQECTKGNLINIINGLNSKENDIIFFYYSGHGTHSSQQMNEKYPQMCMKYQSIQDQKEFMSVKAAEELIDKKPAHLRFIITDCCNNVVQSVMPRGYIDAQKGPTNESEMDIAALKKLFLNTNGKVKATSSKITQTSGGSEYNGGVFTSNFLDVLVGAEYGEVEADWNKIFNETKSVVMRRTDNKQEPVYDIMTSYNGTTPPPGQNTQTTPAPTTQQAPGTTISKLEQYLTSLVNRNESESSRLAKIPSILSQCFSSGAKVQVLGRNLKTTVDVIDAEDYLRRIVQTEGIKKVNIIRQAEGNALNSLIKVHEIRN